MTTLYKLTTQDNFTRPGETNETLWGPGITHEAKGLGDDLCTSGVIHAYEHPVLALLLNPIHANYQNPKLWEAQGDIVARECQLKVGCKKLTTLREIEIPKISTEFRITFAIKCALKVCNEPKFVAWANNWLTGKDRSSKAAEAAAWAAEAAAWAAARAAEAAGAAARAARAAYWAAARAAYWAAARAARAARAAEEAEAAAWAARAAYWAAAEAKEAAVRAAWAAAEAGVNLIEIIEEINQ